MLREHGYHTRWLGKWHLTHRDNHWTPLAGERALERYGFAGGIYPSPDGGPGQGWRTDPKIAAEFADWYRQEGGAEPWCTTVSFVNPHDIAWWYLWSDRVPSEACGRSARCARCRPTTRPRNCWPHATSPACSTPCSRRPLRPSARCPSTAPKPSRGGWNSWTCTRSFSARSTTTSDSVLRTLHSRPEIAANTVIVFTSDHGEYGASHGLRGKGASGYEEAIRVPLIVKDLRGQITAATAQPRTQLTSSVDVAPLLLTIATGSSAWRSEAHYSHLAQRLDLGRILADPEAPGRPYVLHATDEVVTEFAIAAYSADAPRHVVAMRTPEAKYTAYTHWPEEGIAPLSEGEENELYDYSNGSGRMELHNGAGESPLEEGLRAQLQHAFHQELRRPLPPRLGEAHARGYADFFSTARRAAETAAARRKRREETEDTTDEPALGEPEAHANLRPKDSRRRRHR